MTVAIWVEEEWGTVDLKYKRRNTRLKRLVSDLAAMPAASIPTAVGGGHQETAAADRFFDVSDRSPPSGLPRWFTGFCATENRYQFRGSAKTGEPLGQAQWGCVGRVFFDHPNVDFDAILAPHREATLARIRQHNSVLFVEDTTEIDVTRPEQQVASARPKMGRNSLRLNAHAGNVRARRAIESLMWSLLASRHAPDTVRDTRFLESAHTGSTFTTYK